MSLRGIAICILLGIGQCTVPTEPPMPSVEDASASRRRPVRSPALVESVTDYHPAVVVKFWKPVTVDTRVCGGEVGHIKFNCTIEAGNDSCSARLTDPRDTRPTTRLWLNDQCCADSQAIWKKG